MGTPYENAPVESGSINGGSSGIVALDYTTRTIINSIRVAQSTGTPVTFDVELFNRDPTNLGGMPLRLFAVCGKKTATVAGELIFFSDENTGGHGYGFYNQDPIPKTRIQAKQRKLYV